MNITFVVPEIHDLQSGGNVYNRRMARELEAEAPVHVEIWSPGERPSPDFESPESGAIVVDSLLARSPGATEALRAARPEATLVLLVHYLRAIDPEMSDSRTARAERQALGGVDGAIATSRFARDALVDEGMDGDRVAVVPPGLDDRFRGPLPERSGRTVSRILTVANLLPEKGLTQFVDVLADLRYKPWSWTLVGDRTLDRVYAQAVMEKVGRAGLLGRVAATGALSREALRERYDRADLFVLPSPFETLSMSMREAMARGLPVVAYRSGGVAENFREAEAGRLVPPRQDWALRSALFGLLDDPAARRRMGRAGWERSQAFPSWPEAAERFREALGDLGAPSASAPHEGA